MLISVCVFITGACGTDERGSSDEQAKAQSAPTFADVPLWSFGEEQGLELSRIAGAALLDDGRLAVADPDAGALYLLDPANGNFRQIGTRGSGPGEYRAPELLGTDGSGQLVISDRPQHRVLVFNRDGKAVATRGPGQATAGTMWIPAGVFDDGTMVEIRVGYGEPGPPASITRLIISGGVYQYNDHPARCTAHPHRL
ncbi:MAG TPA: 6-bladed beta-propeller [Gemmatimonadales bacterium]|nr:6-bladed beta-propeller [Gemmatimonadales bacterium]